MRYREFSPAGDLQDWIECYQFFEKTCDETLFSRDFIAPEPYPVLVFKLSGSWDISSSFTLSGFPVNLNVPFLTEAETDSSSEADIVLCSGLRTVEYVHILGNSALVFVQLQPGAGEYFRLFKSAAINGLCPFVEPDMERLLYLLRELYTDGRVSAFVDVLDSFFKKRIALRCPFRDEGICNALRSGVLTTPGQSVESAAELCGLSVRSLERKCLSLAGYTPVEYRQISRCSLARSSLWARPEQDLSNLALSLGYSDLPQFCKGFKRYSGCTPTEYSRFCEPFRSRMTGENYMKYHQQRLEVLESQF
jgi:AraC-like DNA-binding protein